MAALGGLHVKHCNGRTIFLFMFVVCAAAVVLSGSPALLTSTITASPQTGFSRHPARIPINLKGQNDAGSAKDIQPKLRTFWTQYKEKYEKAMLAPHEAKFVLYRPDRAGLGSRLPGVVTALMLAILTDRVLVIDFWNCGASKECDIKWSDFFEQDVEADFTNLFRSNAVFANMVSSPGWMSSENSKEINFLQDFMMDLASTSKFQWIWGWGNGDWTAHLWAANPEHQARLDSMFTPGHRFYDASHLLMRPARKIRDSIEAWQAQFRKLTIGVQIRLLKAEWNGGYSRAAFFSGPEVIQAQHVVASAETAIYLATDDLEIRADWIETFENSSMALLAQDASSVNGDGEEGLRRNDLAGLQMAIQEMFILSHVDELIITQSSSFGSLAAALGR